MTDHPVIFSAPMVRAILREIEQPGTGKTQTRRLAWRDALFGLQDYSSEQLEEFDAKGWHVENEDPAGAAFNYRVYKPTAWQKVEPGDRLWVRENWRPDPNGRMYDDSIWLKYIAEINSPQQLVKVPADWKLPKQAHNGVVPSIHMPRWASRITLTVVSTKIERLQSIKDRDCKAEGITGFIDRLVDQWRHGIDAGNGQYTHTGVSFKDSWQNLWTDINGHDSWNANPEVVATTFRPTLANIDRMPPCSPPTPSEPPGS